MNSAVRDQSLESLEFFEDFTSGPTYSELIVEMFARWGDREAFVLGERRLTFRESAALLSQIQQTFTSRGARRGSGVGALSVNVPEVWLAQAATYLNAGHYTGLHPMGSLDDHVWVCDDAEIEILLVHPAFAETGAQIAARSQSVKHLLFLGENGHGENLFDVMAQFDPKPLERGQAEESDIAWLQYTGGTTGRPKGVMLSQRAMVELARTGLTSWELPLEPRYLVAPPITHAGLMPTLATLARGGCVILEQGFQPQKFLAALEREKANCAFVVPTMIYAILDQTRAEDYDLSTLETLIYGASPITPARLAEALERFGPKLVQLYGQTECVGITSSLLRSEHDPKTRPDLLTSCGRPSMGVSVRILDDHDNEVADGTPGELCVKSRAVMSGYWKQPELTAETLRGGWLHTGDIGVRDANGYLHIVDRKKDMIITGGFNVYPKEIEDTLASHPNVASAAVIGVPHEKWGESVTAFVVARAGADVNMDELKALVREAKGPHQTPKLIHVVRELPTTLVGKIDKKLLRSEAAARTEGDEA